MHKKDYMLEVIKNMLRRKFRTFLTVFGIAIGVLALIFMGAMAEKITKLVSGGTDYYSDKVVVYGEGGISGFAAIFLRSSVLFLFTLTLFFTVRSWFSSSLPSLT